MQPSQSSTQTRKCRIEGWIDAAFAPVTYQASFRFLEPVLRPIRNVLPNTGQIDFSPLVLIILLNIVLIILGNVIYG